jgi:hypothetical protein
LQWYPRNGIPEKVLDTHEPETEDYRDVVFKENLGTVALPAKWMD